jgi:predicted PurR-regulated permease PerM
MEPLIILIIAGVGMSLCSIPVIAFYFILEEEHRKNEIKRYVRRKIINDMKEESSGMKDKIDILHEYK